ncbi:hypothetical protein LOTGIDRAFT_169246 [Lottia gigantea]|uniref:protein-ribulosamine 3-kinase n=1 Tax=Lottia gigantea TaxID=225164 RepID=V3YZE4_LOTGI|nr:hypothetical protein LOTGIDRAFT_169246 [Lottia gigantea]ESO83553.1 hypothetical protein LOTGIDRAFT_169246 [Lottia gigantea]
MEDFKLIESDIQLALNDENLHFEKEVKGGIVNKAALFSSTDSSQYFIKLNDNDVATEMFEAESNSLDFLSRTKIIDVPKSYKVLNISNNEVNNYSVHILEYIPDLEPMTTYWSELGEKIARLHTFNSSLKELADKKDGFIQGDDNDDESDSYVDKFGSLLPRYLGIFRLDPVQRSSWEEYFIGDILEPLQVGLANKYGDRSLLSKWSWLRIHMSKLFQDVEITPEVNHGDLCQANFGQTSNGPVLFDPSVNYAHTEFDLLLSYHEESFHDDFFKGYYEVLPEQPGIEKRMEAYKFFYNVIMWYHIDDDKYKVEAHNSADKIKDLIEHQNK